VLRRILGLVRNEDTGEWRKLHKEELRDLCSSQSIIKMIKSRWIRRPGLVARVRREDECTYNFVENLEGNRPLGRPRRK
jgi:hypothetical protein